MATHLDILNAVQSVLQTVSANASILVRKFPFWIAEYDTFPMVCISPEAEIINAETFENTVWIDYPVVVMHVATRGSDPENQNQILDQLRFREQARLSLWRPSLAGVSSVFDCSYEPNPPFDLTALENSFDVSLQLFTFRTSEARATS
jgi:hypothetical protein